MVVEHVKDPVFIFQEEKAYYYAARWHDNTQIMHNSVRTIKLMTVATTTKRIIRETREKGGGEREREREREGERDRETERQRETETERQRQKDRETETKRQAGRQTGRQRDRQTDTETETER